MFASSHPPKVPYPLKPYTFSFTALGPEFSKMTPQNFGPNSFCGLSTIFQGQWPNQGGAPQDPPQEATMYSTGSLLGLEMAMRKQKKLLFGSSKCLLEATNGHLEAQNAIWKLKNEHFEAQKGKSRQNAAFEPPIFQNDTPQFWAKFFLWP